MEIAMDPRGMIIRHLLYTGATVKPAELSFLPGTNVIWGASNTGKSFTLKSIDFMLGGGKALPDCEQRAGYETIWLGFSLTNVGDFTLSRSVKGGHYSLYEGLQKSADSTRKLGDLSAKQTADSEKSVSAFLLNHLGLDGKRVANNSYGRTEKLSFRHLARLLLVDETSIQSERSPVESGQRDDIVVERSVFRLLLTGSDDGALVALPDDKTFSTAKATRLEIMDEMIGALDGELAEDYPDIIDLPAQNERLTATLAGIQAEFEDAQRAVGPLLEEKQQLALEIPRIGGRLDEIRAHFGRFQKLDRIYASDIERLEALEEAGFLLSIGGDRDCPLCGAPSKAQHHMHSLLSIEQQRKAALAEISKIRSQQIDLSKTRVELERDEEELTSMLPELQARLTKVEEEIGLRLPTIKASKQRLAEFLELRDRVRKGLSLLEQRAALLARRQEFEKLKKVAKANKPSLDLPGATAHDFCQVISRVLERWQFPGERHVSFDEKTYDIRINGKLRTDNGKGVRAVTHAAFKIALLIFCREHNLPHPGFVVLDTPLLTYRDPLKSPKHGALTADEKELAATSIRQRFFEHLHSLRSVGQFIILENVDLPANITQLAHVEEFAGAIEGRRQGLFPLN